jgi:hypothetical protein
MSRRLSFLASPQSGRGRSFPLPPSSGGASKVQTQRPGGGFRQCCMETMSGVLNESNPAKSPPPVRQRGASCCPGKTRHSLEKQSICLTRTTAQCIPRKPTNERNYHNRESGPTKQMKPPVPEHHLSPLRKDARNDRGQQIRRQIVIRILNARK